MIGHFSIDGAMKKDHFNRSLGDYVPNMFIVDELTVHDPPIQLVSQIVELLTYPGQTVVDTTYSGKCVYVYCVCECAHMCVYSCVCVCVCIYVCTCVYVCV